MALRENTLLQGGKYRIVRFIASGGFGCTYEAEHVMLNNRVAIKEFFPEDFCNRDETTGRVSVGITGRAALVSKLKTKFLDEARSLFRLNHPGIVRVTDVFEENGTAYFVMDYVEGESLGEMVKRRGPLPEREAVKYILDVCSALEYLHANHRLHLDIKPGNILVNNKGNAILIDFGTSKYYDEENGENKSTLLGKTPGYAPLEQLDNDVSMFMPATDIYALGATLYKLLTGVTPPSSNRMAGGAPLPPMSPSTSPGVRRAVMWALQPKALSRPQTIKAFRETIIGGENINADKAEATQISEKTQISVGNYQTTNKSRKPFIFVIVGVLCVVVLILLYTVSDCSGHHSARETKDATSADTASAVEEEAVIEVEEVVEAPADDELNNEPGLGDMPNSESTAKSSSDIQENIAPKPAAHKKTKNTAKSSSDIQENIAPQPASLYETQRTSKSQHDELLQNVTTPVAE